MTGFANPADPTGISMYPSGIKDCDNGFMLNPESPYPIIKISSLVYDKNYTEVPPGIYQVKISEDEKKVLFYQGSSRKAEFGVIKITKFQTLKNISTVNSENDDPHNLIFSIRIANKEFVAVAYKE